MANSSPLPEDSLQTCFSAQPPPALADTCLRLGSEGLWHRPSVQVLFCPAVHGPACALASDSPQNTPSTSPDLTTRKGAFPGVVTSLFLQLPSHSCRSHSSSSLFFLFSLLSYPLCRHIFLSFWCLRSSASVQQVLCASCSTCRCILDVLVGRGEPHTLLFCHLDPLSLYPLN